MTLIVETILCRPKTMDNYSYLITDKETDISAVIDPSEAEPIIARCQKLNLKPSYILSTHHHFDHTQGNAELKKLFNLKVIGAEKRIPEVDIILNPGDSFYIGKTKGEMIDVSAHTYGHVVWHFPDNRLLFTGDTLFNLCIGGLFEGNIKNMFNALEKIKSLPNETLFYPGHEYTLQAIPFALKHCNNEALVEYIKTAERRLSRNIPSHPVALGAEKECNPYLIAATFETFENLF